MDVLAYLAGPNADLEWRRGWTHGVLALAVLPFALTAALIAVDRLRFRYRRSKAGAAVPVEILRLSCIAILSHPFLDTLNTYGVRWLMPFDGTWFYGDTLFIVDPWVWVALAVGIYYSLRLRGAEDRDSSRPAKAALGLVAAYVAAMAISGRVARSMIASEVASVTGRPVERVMAGPAPLNPLLRRFVVEQRGEYRTGTFSWVERPHVRRGDLLIFPRGRPVHPAFPAAAATLPARRFLRWARFPTFGVVQEGPGRYNVHFVDLRYARSPDDSFGALSVPVTFGRAYGIRR